MPEFSVSDLKRALVEVSTMCQNREWCGAPDNCPFWDVSHAWCRLSHSYPENWCVDDWKEGEPDAED